MGPVYNRGSPLAGPGKGILVNRDREGRPQRRTKHLIREGRLEEPLPRVSFARKGGGMLYFKNPLMASPFPNDISVCLDFSCRGRECNVKGRGICPKGTHVFSPTVIEVKDLELVGDKFLADGSGWFSTMAFKGFSHLGRKYKKLIGD